MRSCHASRVTCHHESGIALVITLIMLAITLVMAVAFLALAKRERASVTGSTDITTARLAADTAVANAEGQIVANILNGQLNGGSSNAYNLHLLVSTNYINSYGFASGSRSPTNVNYAYANGYPDREQNISNLWYLPRAPVYVPLSQPVTNYDFRYYLDLNQNGRFEVNGWQTNYDANGNVLLDAAISTNPPVVTFLTGDPEWVGVLEHPDAPHGPNNHFIARYAFIAVPVGNTLDVNYIHNQAQNLASQTANNLLDVKDGYMRNQGVGAWEINLAAFLADLNTNIWSPVSLPANLYYAYNEPGGYNSGYAFQDALSLLSYRYNSRSLPAASGFLRNTLFTLPNDGLDAYSDGPLQTTLNTNSDWAAVGTDGDRTPTTKSWSGADNPNHYFALSDFFDSAKVGSGANSFPGRLGSAGNALDTYDRYTYYRMLDQLGTDSTADDGKLNLNYCNIDTNMVDRVGNAFGVVTNGISVIPGAETNMVQWNPLDFFLAASDKLIRSYTTDWYGPNGANYRAFTNDFAVTAPFGVTNIPVWVSNRFVYPSVVNRLLQLAANIYDASTNGDNNFPHVFRPLFKRVINGTNNDIFIIGYTPVTSVRIPANQGDFDPQLAPPYDVTLLGGALTTPIADGNGPVNIYGVPWIVGAKKGLPNFNQFYMLNSAEVVRKLQVVRPNLTKDLKLYYTNEMYVASITNYFGFSFWNSYTASRPGNYTIALNNSVRMVQFVTNSTGLLMYYSNAVAGFNFFYKTNIWPGSAWGYNGRFGTDADPKPASFITGWGMFSFLPQSVLRYFPGSVTFQAYAPGSAWDPSVRSLPPFPHFQLTTTNWLQAYILDGNHVIDYVQLSSAGTPRDLATELQDPDYLRLSQPVLLWSTNLSGPAFDGAPAGDLNQMAISLGNKAAPHNTWRDSPAISSPLKASEITDFHNFYFGNTLGNDTAQVPYTPARTMYDFTSWQANDPLVHYMTSDLADIDRGVIGTHRTDDPLNPFSAIQDELKLNTVHQRYQPWGRNAQLNRSTLAGLVDTNAYNMRFRDPLSWSSDYWDFPTNRYPTVGWLGRVHRGTPWQTVYWKATDLLGEAALDTHGTPTYIGSNTWSFWTGNANLFEASLSGPLQDRLLPDIFTARLNDNAARGTLPVNQTQLAAWSALFSGMVVLSNNIPDVDLGINSSLSSSNLIINPVGVLDATATPPPLWQIVNHTLKGAAGIVEAHAVFTNADGATGAFERAGDILNTPALTEQSPFLNLSDKQRIYGINDEMYEWLPQQMLGLVRGTQPRYALYCVGQALRPAPNGTVLSGSFFQLVTNYQVVAESAVRAVIRVDNANTAKPHAVVETSNVLPPN